MAGPLTTVWYVFKDGFISKSANPPIWIILIGALGLVIGLATYGYKVTRAMGVRLAKISPTRGFAAELATALIITIAAQYGLPTSSSQCITGTSSASLYLLYIFGATVTYNYMSQMCERIGRN